MTFSCLEIGYPYVAQAALELVLFLPQASGMLGWQACVSMYSSKKLSLTYEQPNNIN